MDENEESVLAAEALIGDDAEAFIRSELGRTILGIAKQEAQSAMEQLKSASAADQDKIRALQNEIWRAEQFEDWLLELIDRGAQAIKIVQHEADTHE